MGRSQIAVKIVEDVHSRATVVPKRLSAMQSSAGGLDEDRPCNVCFSVCSKLAEPENEMIFCDGCDVCVHQSCYGVLKIPDGDWFCDRCAVKAKDEPCVLCPVYEGAMKRTEQGDWCHVSCVWWIPEVHFKDTILMRPVMGIPDVSKKRFQLKCMFCDTKNGACIECSHKNCKNSFHVTCAFATKESHNGATFLMYEVDEEHDLIRKAFCPKHREQQAIERAKVKEKITATNSQNHHPKHVSEVPSSRKTADGSHRLKSKPSSKEVMPKIQTAPPTPKILARATDSRSKLSSSSPATASPVLKHLRRDVSSAYARAPVTAADENEQDSPKRARKSKENHAYAEEVRVSKEFRHASVDTQDHPCTGLLPPLMRWTNETHASSLFHASALSRDSIFSSMEGSYE